MKPATFVAILLTFLMAILVLGAAVIFLLQGRQEFQTQIESQVATGTAQAGERLQLEAILDSESSALAAKQAEVSTRDAEFMRISQEAIQLEQQLDAASTALAAAATLTPDAVALAPPTVEFISPQEGVSFEIDGLTEVSFVVGHPVGIAAVELTANDQIIELEPNDGRTLQRFDEEFQFLTSGEVVFSVVAASTLGAIGEPELLTVTVIVPATPTPSPAPTAAPAATPTVTGTTGDAGQVPTIGLLAMGEQGEESGSRLEVIAGWLADPRRL